MKLPILSIFCCVLAACSSTPLQQNDLLAEIQQAGFAPTDVSVLMQPLFPGAKAVGYRADVAMAPASTMKVLTTTVALARLGADWRGYTRLALAPQDYERLQQQATTPALSFRLQHPLYLQAGSDADLNDAELRALLQQVRALGITDLGAGIVLDRSKFMPVRTDIGSVDFDEQPKARYNHQPDALYLGQSQMVLRLSADKDRLQAVVTPYWPALQLDVSGVRLVNTSCDNIRLTNLSATIKTTDAVQHSMQANVNFQPQQGRWVLQLAGEFAKDCQQQSSFALIDRDISLMLSLEQEWLSLGGSIWSQTTAASALCCKKQQTDNTTIQQPATDQKPSALMLPLDITTPLLPDLAATHWLKTGASPADTVTVALHASRPLGELARRVNKSSDNALTRLLFLTLGSEIKDAEQQLQQHNKEALPATTKQRSEQQIRLWLQQQGIKDHRLVLENGSGLSRTERLSATLLAQVLQTAWQADYGPELLASLPLAGVDGTLTNRFRSGPAYRKARLKTGTLRDVTALAGYVWDSQNRPWVVVMMVNSDKAAVAGRPLLDTLVQQLAGSH